MPLSPGNERRESKRCLIPNLIFGMRHQIRPPLGLPPFRLPADRHGGGDRKKIGGKTGYWAAVSPPSNPFLRYVPRPPGGIGWDENQGERLTCVVNHIRVANPQGIWKPYSARTFLGNSKRTVLSGSTIWQNLSSPTRLISMPASLRGILTVSVKNCAMR